MKNIITNLFPTVVIKQSLLLVVAMLLCTTVLRADIINPSATSSDGYISDNTSNVVIQTLFESNTFEYVTNIEFSVSAPAMGVTLDFGVPSPSPYDNDCGSNVGDEVGNVAWNGSVLFFGDICGAFSSETLVDFGISITADATVSGPIVLDVTFTGDGFGNGGIPSVVTTQVVIQQITCVLDCPADMTVSADPGMCGANVNIPLPTTVEEPCTPGPIDQSGFYEVGTHEIVFVANSGGAMEAVCSMMLTVVDTQEPVVVDCDNITVHLEAGECAAEIASPFSYSDNCQDLDFVISQNGMNDEIEDGIRCPGGSSSYLRIFDLASFGANTEVTVQSVSIGVFESMNNAKVDVNLYKYNGSLAPSDLELISSNSQTLPNSSLYYEDIAISGTFDPTDIIVVEVTTQTGFVSGFTMGFNTGGQTGPTYFKSDFCGIEDAVDIDPFFSGYGALISLNAVKSAFAVTQTDNSGQSIDDPFEAGIYNLAFDINDIYGNTTQCAFTVEVVEFISPIGSIACNEEVNISLDDKCSQVVTADMILKGAQYGCFDDYTVSISTADGVLIGDEVGADQVGMTLIATVSDPNGNSCWGNIVVEDKIGPTLDCMDIYTTCTGTTDPGDPVSQMVTYAGDVDGVIIDSSIPSVTDIDVEVFGLEGATVTDVNVVIDIDHTYPSDLIASVKAPNGDEVALFILPGEDCGEQGIRVTIDDEAMSTSGDLSSLDACVVGVTPSISGAYQPVAPLSEFDGIDPNGTWTVSISDNFNGDGGVVNAVNIVVSQSGAKIAFPTSNDITYQQIDDKVYSVNGLDLCGPVTLGYNDNKMEQECSSDFSEIIERTWTGNDESGNPVFSCVQNIYVYRNDLSTLTFPPNYDGIQLPTLSCSQFGDNVPTPATTGQPSGDFCDNVQMFPYEDTRVEICPGSYKIIRNFKLLEWCSNQVIEHTQIIKVEDKNGPNIPFVADLTISANAEECLADVSIDRPTITSDCTPSEDLEYELAWAIATSSGAPDPDAYYSTDNISTLFNGNALVRDLPVGRVWMQWTVSDQCGNSSTRRFTITVEDQVPPFAICDEFTVVGLSGDGKAVVNAITFDDGSFDNCGPIVSYKARKMNNACGGSNSFAESVTFCCAERGQEVMVQFQVTDAQGLSNTCMVTVSVEDKLPPFITFCPADITLDCLSDIDPSITGYIEFIDNCEVVDDYYNDSVLSENNCGEKKVRRVFTIVDAAGLKNTCSQTITVETSNSSQFGANDINWPSDIDRNGCADDYDPDSAPGPILNDTGCSLVASYAEDQVFTLAGACVKILRKWTVIDWCQYNENNPVLGQGWWEKTQVIKISNNEAPTFISNCNNRQECITGDNCHGSVTLSANATDDCTPAEQIAYSYAVDTDNDGTDNISGNGSTLTRTFSEGTHRITWTAEDGCGNAGTCSYLFTVRDCKKPTPYCITSLTTVVMPSSGMITINAEDYNFGSSDNCTPTEDLRYSFSSNANDKTRTFTCDDIPNGDSAEISLRMYVTDNNGNQDYCTIKIIIQEGSEDQCESTGNLVLLSGQVHTENFETIDEALVLMKSSAPEIDGQMMTEEDGNYIFSNLPINYDYEVSAEKNNDYTNGVSTLDLVLIQRHILGFAEFTSPYKVIASDIDNNQKVSASDIVALRKLVLGITPQYPNGQTSWRFVDGSQVFNDVFSPWPYDESITLHNVNSNKTQMDLVAVKIGDVNSSASFNVNGTETTENRSSKTITFSTNMIDVPEGYQIKLPIYAQDFNDILGFQFTIEFDASKLNFNGYEMGALVVSDKNFALNRLDQGFVATSWSDMEPVSVTDDEPLFYLSFTAHGSGNIGDLIDFTSRITDAEVYDANYTVHGVDLRLRGSDNELLTNGLTVEQNRPNPFSTTTDINFTIDVDSPITLTIMDMSGKVLRKTTKEYTAGSHTITLDTETIATSGLLYYRIDADQGSAVRKMIKIK